MNNPLKYTDPSGYLWNPFKAIAKAIAKAWRGLWRGIKKYARVVVAGSYTLPFICISPISSICS
jgi:hypothetical protein